MRRPAYVKIEENVQGVGEEGDSLLIQGEEHKIKTTLYALAGIAWNMGWRPEGLQAVIGNSVLNHKVPPAT